MIHFNGIEPLRVPVGVRDLLDHYLFPTRWALLRHGLRNKHKRTTLKESSCERKEQNQERLDAGGLSPFTILRTSAIKYQHLSGLRVDIKRESDRKELSLSPPDRTHHIKLRLPISNIDNCHCRYGSDCLLISLSPEIALRANKNNERVTSDFELTRSKSCF
jgi:hypothetical protein